VRRAHTIEAVQEAAAALCARHGRCTASGVALRMGGAQAEAVRAHLEALVRRGELDRVEGAPDALGRVTVHYHTAAARRRVERAILSCLAETGAPHSARALADATGCALPSVRRAARALVERGAALETPGHHPCASTWYHAGPLACAQLARVRELQRLEVEAQANTSITRNRPRGVATLERRLADARRKLEVAQARLDAALAAMQDKET
jgi:hypothetical protein